MALRNILEDGDPILRKTCREVDQVTERTQMILDDMVETMRQAQGVGLEPRRWVSCGECS